MKRCYFGNHPIKGKAERHHIVPRRYWKKGESHRRNNLAWCCPEHHARWHREFDNPRLSLDGYLNAFGALALGKGVFDGD